MPSTNTPPFPDKVRRVRAFAGALGAQQASTVLPSSAAGLMLHACVRSGPGAFCRAKWVSVGLED